MVNEITLTLPVSSVASLVVDTIESSIGDSR